MSNHLLMGKYGEREGKESPDPYRPVLPTKRLLPEITNSHWKTNHRGYRFCLEDLHNKFFIMQGVTTPQDVTGLAKLLSKACTLCLHRTPNHEPKLFYQTRKVALSLNLPLCSTLSHDVMYLAGSQRYSAPRLQYISIIVCNSCNYLSAKPLLQNNAEEIARHLLEFIQESGRIPSLLLSDSGIAQKGPSTTSATLC